MIPTPTEPTAPAESATSAVVAAPCRSSTVEITAAEGHSVADEPSRFATDFTVSNASSEPCAVGGWPGFTMVGDATVRACGPGQPKPCGGPVDKDGHFDQDLRRVGTAPPTITLQAGETTSFSASSEAMTCLHPPYRVEVLLVADDVPISLVEPGSPYGLCAESTVYVTPFGVLSP